MKDEESNHLLLSSQESGFKLRELLPLLLVRWHWLLLGTLLGLGWGFFKAWKTVPIYQSQATVLVRDYSVSVLKTIDAAEFDLRSNSALETVRAGLLKYELCERVASDPKVRELEFIVPPPPKKLSEVFSKEEVAESQTKETPPSPQLAGMIRSWLSVNLQGDSRLMSVTIQHPEPKVAAVIANSVVDEYIKQRAEVKETSKMKSFELLDAQAERLKSKLSQSKTKLSIYETPNKAELVLGSAEEEFSEIQLRYRAKHPSFIEAQSKVKLAKEQLFRALKKVLANPTDEEYWQDQGMTASQLEQERGLNDLREKLIERRAQLETEIESQSKISETLLTQVETTEINKEQNEAEVVPYEKARPPRAPITEAKSKLVTKNTIIGVFGGIALALLFSFLDKKFHTVTDVEKKLSLPVLAAVPALTSKDLKKRGDAIPGREGWDSSLIFSHRETETVVAESYRVLRAAVSLLGPASERKTTLFTSALPSEGKTTTAANFACAMALQGQQVILIDLDLRKPSVHKIFGRQKEEGQGVVGVLAGNEEVDETIITDSGLPNLHLMLSGPKAPNPGELLDSSRLQRFIKLLAERYDHVVVDSAPVLAVADSRLIAPLIDNFCIVLRANQSPKGAVARALEILENSGKRPSGIVFNGFEERRIMQGKNYSYGSYSTVYGVGD